MSIKAIVTDIEGTTTSLSFVKDVLFPYAREHIAEFIRAHRDDETVKKLLADVKSLAEQQLDEQGIINLLIKWIDEDQKITPLKGLQGLIWQAGYKNGDFTGHVYTDAVENLRKWHAAGIKLYVFSSGSIKAQQLLFGFSDFGDLTSLFSEYFDTKIGAKREVEAYQHIQKKVAEQAGEILFLSDIVEELDAAQAAGLKTIQLVRESQEKSPNHCQAIDFDQVSLIIDSVWSG